MTDGDRVLQERLGALVGGGREDWKDVRRRARAHGYRRVRPTWIWLALVTAGLALAAAPPLGRSVLDLFRDPEKPALPRTAFEPLMRLSFDRKFGEWSVHQVASDGRTVFYSLRDGDGEVVCIMEGRADWKSAGLRNPFGAMSCGDPGVLLSPARPFYYQVGVEMTPDSHGPRPFRVTGVAADGVEAIVLTGAGERMEFPVEDHAFTITTFPEEAQTIKIAAVDGDGTELFREPLTGFGPAPDLPLTGSPPPPAALRPADAPLVPRRGERPIQQARSGDAELRVYRDGLVVFRIEPGSRAARLVTPSFGCLKYTEIDGDTYPVWSHGSGNLAPSGTSVRGRARGALVDPPYDGCEVNGDFGRHWNDPRGVHSPVEVPLTDAGERFFDERAAARDLASFVRSPRIRALRRILRADAHASLPSAEAIRRGLPMRVVALGSPHASPGPGRIGLWSERRLLVASTGTAAGKRLFVELESGRIVRHNLGDLARLR
jgi:hypothetical protein